MAAVCVFCASSNSIDPAFISLATTVGSRLAAAGHSLVSGGGSVSMMGAVAEATRAGGGHTVGVIPEHLLGYEVGDQEADELIVVQTMRERKQLMDERSDAFICLPGGIGTLEELFEIWTARSLGMHDKPVIVLDLDDFYSPLWRYLDELTERGFVRPGVMETLTRVTTVDAALDAIAEAFPS